MSASHAGIPPQEALRVLDLPEVGAVILYVGVVQGTSCFCGEVANVANVFFFCCRRKASARLFVGRSTAGSGRRVFEAFVPCERLHCNLILDKLAWGCVAVDVLSQREWLCELVALGMMHSANGVWLLRTQSRAVSESNRTEPTSYIIFLQLWYMWVVSWLYSCMRGRTGHRQQTDMIHHYQATWPAISQSHGLLPPSGVSIVEGWAVLHMRKSSRQLPPISGPRVFLSAGTVWLRANNSMLFVIKLTS